MTAEYDHGVKSFFKIIIGASPTLICPPTDRLGVVFFNEGPVQMRIGNPSGTANGILLPSGVFFTDSLSDDDWWATAVTSSGTVSGYIIRGI